MFFPVYKSLKTNNLGVASENADECPSCGQMPPSVQVNRYFVHVFLCFVQVLIPLSI